MVTTPIGSAGSAFASAFSAMMASKASKTVTSALAAAAHAATRTSMPFCLWLSTSAVMHCAAFPLDTRRFFTSAMLRDTTRTHESAEPTNCLTRNGHAPRMLRVIFRVMCVCVCVCVCVCQAASAMHVNQLD